MALKKLFGRRHVFDAEDAMTGFDFGDFIDQQHRIAMRQNLGDFVPAQGKRRQRERRNGHLDARIVGRAHLRPKRSGFGGFGHERKTRGEEKSWVNSLTKEGEAGSWRTRQPQRKVGSHCVRLLNGAQCNGISLFRRQETRETGYRARRYFDRVLRKPLFPSSPVSFVS